MSLLKTTVAILSCFVAAPVADAVTLAFGPAGGPPITIPGSGGITYTTATIQGGTANAATHGASGSVGTSANVGSGAATPYDGTFFPSAVDGDENLVSSINSLRRSRIDGGIASDYGNYLGLCVSFSAPIPMYAFGFIDVDGTSGTNAEWASSFAYDTTTSAVISPAFTIATGSTISLTGAANTVDWSGLDESVTLLAPTSSTVAYQGSMTTNGLTAHDPNSQVAFDYGGAMVDRLYFVWGVREAPGGGGDNNSGVTGFTVIDPIPEPTSSVLIGLGALGLLARRSRG